MLKNWKLPFCYSQSNGSVKGDKLSRLVTDVLTKLFQLKLNPRVVICDQGSNNRTAIQLLGVSINDPKIKINDKVCYVCFDPSHLLKSLRNNFMNRKTELVVTSNAVSWQDIENVDKIDQKSYN